MRDEEKTKKQLISELKELRKEAKDAKRDKSKSKGKGTGSQDREQLYRTLFDAASDAIFIMKKDIFIDCNDMTLEIFGYKDKKEILGHRPWDFSPPKQPDGRDSKKRAKELLRESMKGRTQRFYWQHIRGDGTPFDMDILLSNVKSGNEDYVLAIARDITEQKRAEEALKESEEKFSNLFQTCPNVLVISSLEDGRIIDINGSGIKALGYTREELIGKTSVELGIIGSKDRDHLIEMLKKNGSITGIELKARLKSGEERIGLFHGQLITIGEKQYLFQTIVDITERKQAEEALKVSEEKYRHLINNLPVVTWISDAEGNTTFISPNVIDVYGYTTDEILTSGPVLWFERIHHEDKDKVRNAIATMLTKDIPFDIEYRIQRKDGTWIWLNDRAFMRLEKDGKKYAYGIFNDITESKKANQEISSFYNLSMDLMGIMDFDTNVFRKVNPAFKATLGWDEEELVGSSFMDLVHWRDKERTMVEIEERKSTVTLMKGFEHRVMCKDGTHRWIAWSGNPVPDMNIAVIIGRDITERKKGEQDLMKRVMKYDVEEGRTYLVSEPSPHMAFEAFRDLVRLGHDGFVFSRTPKVEMRRFLEEDFVHKWLAESEGQDAVPPRVDELSKILEDLPSNSTILLDRIDYLIHKIGFDETLSFVSNFREIAYLKNSIGIISVDPDVLDERQLKLLLKECQELEPLHKTTLSPEIFEVLKIIYEAKSKNLSENYNTLTKKLGISRPTARKRVGTLLYMGYITEEKKGTGKNFELTEKGNNVFLRSGDNGINGQVHWP